MDFLDLALRAGNMTTDPMLMRLNLGVGVANDLIALDPKAASAAPSDAV